MSRMALPCRWHTWDDRVDRIAVEYDEFADARLAGSLAAAEAELDALVPRLIADMAGDAGASPVRTATG